MITRKLRKTVVCCLSAFFFACSGERGYIDYRGLSMGLPAKQMVDSLLQKMPNLWLDTTKFDDRYVMADTLARTVAAPAELPVGSITALAGAPYFIWLVLRKKQRRFPPSLVRIWEVAPRYLPIFAL